MSHSNTTTPSPKDRTSSSSSSTSSPQPPHGTDNSATSSTMRYTTFNFFKNVAEYFVPVLKTSHFTERGVLTPEEFVLAGDLIVSKVPTWSWSRGDPSKTKNFLPEDKQFLITRNVPCLRRAKALEQDADDEEVDDAEDGWVTTHLSMTGAAREGDAGGGSDDEVEEIGAALERTAVQGDGGNGSSGNDDDDDDDDDDAIDIDEFDVDNMDDDDEATFVVSSPAKEEKRGDEGGKDNDHVMKTRTYDLTITYDKFYQTPRVWLFGYDESGRPLDPKHVLEDVHADYSLKTVTIERHPHLNSAWASIHPCKHADVMKKMVDRLNHDGQYLRVDLYLYIFLKFISSVIPTIEYDYSISM